MLHEGTLPRDCEHIWRANDYKNQTPKVRTNLLAHTIEPKANSCLGHVSSKKVGKTSGVVSNKVKELDAGSKYELETQDLHMKSTCTAEEAGVRIR
jgi:hypothetical protein